MSELRTILNLATKDSLILGDELCSGTESDSALSIFMAGLERLSKLKCSFIFATHFHEIKNYKHHGIEWLSTVGGGTNGPNGENGMPVSSAVDIDGNIPPDVIVVVVVVVMNNS